MSHYPPVSADPESEQRAAAIWHNFTQGIKLSAAVIAVTLILLTLAFIG